MSVNESPDRFEEESGQDSGRPAAEYDQQDQGERLAVVGIGASAGGLAALQGFFDALPSDTGMAFVVITHMDPERESLLPELLQNHTAMPVRQVHDMVAVEANHVYVIPPGRRIVITDTHLDVEPFEEPRGHRAPIDHFFRSLAQVHHEAVAIILSGGGTDGAVGVKAVKEQGGLLMVQHPDEAEYDSMPRAAIATGLADVVLPVSHLARKLVEYHTNGVQVPQDPERLTTGEMETVYRILTQVQVQTGHDFSQYKHSTILRRIRRRMQLYGLAKLDAYLDTLRHNGSEAQALFNDLLIGVTNFFRDKGAWEALVEQVIPRLFEDRGAEETVRAWTIGCATGEEAYSVAMTLMEHMTRQDVPPAARPAIQVFASDLDEAALNKARDGRYPEAIEADVSPQRLACFFVKEGNYYRVKRELRDVVIFANHSVLRDPPFSRLDLISCRNLLIYLNRDLQENVFQIFHYALSAERYLFLGSAESADVVHQMFRTVDKSHRLYQARSRHGQQPQLPTMSLAVRRPAHWQPVQATPGHGPTREAPGTAAALHLEMLEQSAPPSALVNEAYQVVHLSQTAGRYLQHPGGTVTRDLLKLVRPELQFELRTALFQAFEKDKTVVSRPVFVQFNGAPRRVALAVRPHQASGDATAEAEGRGEAGWLALVFFLEDEMAEAPATGDADNRLAAVEDEEEGTDEAQRQAIMAQLEGEVQRLRQRLQDTTKEYESSTEELEAANEELQSINEEYRSTTEELETSKEELRSVNEELQTVNAELRNKLEEISRAHSDLENLIAATDVATLFLDRALRIQRYTPGTSELFNIMAGDRGRPIGHLTNKLEYETLAEDAAQVLFDLVSIEREVQDTQGQWLLVRLRPYRTVDDRIDGVVLTFVDITELKEAEWELRAAKEYSEKVVDTVREGLLVLEPDLTVEFANESFYDMFEVDEEETVGTLVYNLGNGQWDIPELRRLLEEVLPQKNAFNDFRVEHEFEDIGRRVMLLNGRRRDHVGRILLAIDDVTERETYQEELQALNETLEERVWQRTQEVEALASQLTMAEHEERGRIAQLLHDDLQQQLYSMQIQLEFLRDRADEESVPQEVKAMEQAVATAIATARQLSVDLSPPILEGEGLTEAIGWLATQMQGQYGLTVELEAEGSFPVPEQDRRVLLFQTVRELLFNAVKHAGVSRVAVKLQDVNGGYRIDVVDEGQGFDPDQVLKDRQQQARPAADGRGLLQVRQRLRLIGGRIEVESAPGVGTRVTIVVPIPGQAHASEEEE